MGSAWDTRSHDAKIVRKEQVITNALAAFPRSVLTASLVFDTDAKDLINFVARARRKGAVTYVLKCAPVRKSGAPQYRTVDSWEAADKAEPEPLAEWVRNTAEQDAESVAATTVYTVAALDKDGMLVAQVSDRVEPATAATPEVTPTDGVIDQYKALVELATAHARVCQEHVLEMARMTSGNFAAVTAALTSAYSENRELWKEAAVSDAKAEVTALTAALAKGPTDLSGWLELFKQGWEDIKTYKMLKVQADRERAEADALAAKAQRDVVDVSGGQQVNAPSDENGR